MRALRDIAAAAWAFRTEVEHDAASRFERLAAVVADLDVHSPIVEGLVAAAEDERRHFALCQDLAQRFGARLPERWPAVPPVAPGHLSQREAVLYELAAACCVSETESMATLTTLLQAAGAEPEVEPVVRAITRDEVRHAQLGWAHLSRERQFIDVSFLSELLPRMLAGTVEESLFLPPTDAALDDPELLKLGVLPHSTKRAVFIRALDEIVLPGFAMLGVDDGPARAWLSAKQALSAAHPAVRVGQERGVTPDPGGSS